MADPVAISKIMEKAIEKIVIIQNTTNSNDLAATKKEIPPCSLEDGTCQCGVKLKPEWSLYIQKWLEPPPKCSDCVNKDNIEYYRQKESQRLRENSGFGPRHASMIFDNFIPKNKGQEIAKTRLIQEYSSFRRYWDKATSIEGAEYDTYGSFHITDHEGTRRCGSLIMPTKFIPNIYIYGPVGTGKTHLIASLAFMLMQEYLIPVEFIGGANLLYKIRSTFSSNDGESDDLISEYSNAKLLIIDDIGAEKTSEWVRETFYMIVNNRHVACLPTFVTSNLHPKKLAGKLDDRMVSRLLEDAIVLKLEGEDHRINKKSLHSIEESTPAPTSKVTGNG
jgi:DNA replication protein DnaC